MARIDLTETDLRLEMSAKDKLFALHGSLRIPLEHVVGVIPRPPIPALDDVYTQKFWGTYVPERLLAGSCDVPGVGSTFCDVRDASKAIALDLAGEKWSRIVIQIDDESPELAAGRILEHLARRGVAAVDA